MIAERRKIAATNANTLKPSSMNEYRNTRQSRGHCVNTSVPASCPLFRPGEKPLKGFTCKKCWKKCPKGRKGEYADESLRNER
jgi:hypothetical protein